MITWTSQKAYTGFELPKAEIYGKFKKSLRKIEQHNNKS